MKSNIPIKIHKFYIRQRRHTTFASFWDKWVVIDALDINEAVLKYLKSINQLVDEVSLDEKKNKSYNVTMFARLSGGLAYTGGVRLQCTKEKEQVETIISRIKNNYNKFQYLFVEKYQNKLLILYFTVLLLKIIFSKVLFFTYFLFAFILCIWLPLILVITFSFIYHCSNLRGY